MSREIERCERKGRRGKWEMMWCHSTIHRLRDMEDMQSYLVNLLSHLPWYNYTHTCSKMTVSKSIRGTQVKKGGLSRSKLSSFPLSRFKLSSFPLSRSKHSSFPLSRSKLSSFPLSRFKLSSFPLSRSKLSSFPKTKLTCRSDREHCRDL